VWRARTELLGCMSVSSQVTVIDGMDPVAFAQEAPSMNPAPA